ncbi:hypothetical protein ScPMuIL_014882 [Solemya velum]
MKSFRSLGTFPSLLSMAYRNTPESNVRRPSQKDHGDGSTLLSKSALEITGENLEDLLAYDDLFLDFFNAFLSLPVFPQALAYNRLTGAFEEVDTTSNGSKQAVPLGLPYGATDQERDSMLEWARQKRLPLFFSTQVFREFKLCKLLLRPLDDHHSASRGSSQQIRGYSRQTESYVSSLSNSGDNSANDGLDDDDAYGDAVYSHSAFYERYQRPGSRAVSVPARIYCSDSEGQYGSTTTETQQSSPLSKSASQKYRPKMTSNIPFVPESTRDSGHGTSIQYTVDDKLSRGNTLLRDGTVVTFDPRTEEQSSAARSRRSSRYSPGKRAPPPTSDSEAAFLRHARVLSAPVNYEEFHRHPMFDYDYMFGEEEPEPDGPVYVRFEDEPVSEEQTETDVKNLESRLKITLQEMKEQVLGMSLGMEAYRNFLVGTAGEHLYNFWLDCEYFKDTMENFDEETNNNVRNRLFRDIQDKYKLNLTKEAKEQIARAASNANLSHTVFIRTQYDVLRRLRAYWVPRFLLHQERTQFLSSGPNRNEALLQSVRERSMVPRSNTLPFFPSISLVNSMPVHPEDILSFSRTKTWDIVCRCGHGFDQRIKSAKTMVSPRIQATKERFLIALTADKVAGGPFQQYLEKTDKLLLSNFLFWQDVTEYGASEDRSSDRLLRLGQGWAIYNSYISDGSSHNIGLSNREQDTLHNTLLVARDFIEASVFDNAKYHAVNKLEKAWIRFLKEDLKDFLDCRVRQGERSPPSTADAIEITFCNGELRIHRPRPWAKRYTNYSSVSYYSSLGKRPIEEVDEKTRAELKAKARERKREMERERKKAIRAAYRRVRESKTKKTESNENERGDADFVDFGEAAKSSGKPPPPFQEMTGNKQIMTSFKKHLQDGEDKERISMLHLYLDIDSYHALGTNKKGKDTQAHLIHKTYLEPNAKKHLKFNEKIQHRLLSEKDRPKSATVREMQHFVLPKIDESFSAYIISKAEENGLDAHALVNLSQAELAMRMGSDAAMLGGWKKKFKGKHTGRAQPTKEDREEFFKTLKASAAGQLSLPMLYFYKYLVKHGPEDGVPLIDKSMFFYLEAQKFKDCSHAFADDELLRHKVQSIVDCFLESVTGPVVQVDLPAELQQRTLRQAQRYLHMAGRDASSNIFDEAQLTVFKELLPYWAGFKKAYAPPDDPTKTPVTKYQKMLKKRLDTINNYKMPPRVFSLPAIPEGGVAAYTFTLSEGVKWREVHHDDNASVMGDRIASRATRMTAAMDAMKKRRPSYISVASSGDYPSRRSSIIMRS